MKSRSNEEILRRGLTLIEVLVVVSILALLASLMLPGVRNAREAARRTQCLNNMRNVGLAMQTYATANNGQLPTLTDATMPLGSGLGGRPANWSFQLHPYLYGSTLYMDLQAVTTRSEANQLADMNFHVFLCPDDPLEEAQGRLGFVVNAGLMTESRWRELENTSHAVDAYDYPFDGTGVITAADQDVAFATGVFWRAHANSPARFRISLNAIALADGTSQTLLLTENLDTRPFDAATQTGGWSSIATGDLAFGIPVEEAGDASVVADNSIAGGIGIKWSAEQPLTSTALVPSDSEFLTDFGHINASLGIGTPGATPRPSSLHPGVVNVMFCDGSGRILSQQVEASVYLRLVTHNGTSFGQDLLGSHEY